MLKYISSQNKMRTEVGFSTDLFRNSLPKPSATHYSECVLRNNRTLFLAVSIANSPTVDSSMFHEVLVIPYVKICEFSADISQGYFGIILECSFGLGKLKKQAQIFLAKK